MGRRVITAMDVANARKPVDKGLTAEAATQTPATGQADDYYAKLLKYIPAEIVAAFVAIQGIITSNSQPAQWVYWVVFIVLLVMTPLYLWRVTNEPNKPVAAPQIVISTIGFAVWVFALGGPFSQYGWYKTLYGAVLLILYTVAIPIFVGRSPAPAAK
jgi:hypothetical protein